MEEAIQTTKREKFKDKVSSRVFDENAQELHNVLRKDEMRNEERTDRVVEHLENERLLLKRLGMFKALERLGSNGQSIPISLVDVAKVARAELFLQDDVGKTLCNHLELHGDL